MKLRLMKILRKYVINNIGYKILAILFAFLLWVVILNTTDPEYTRTISNIQVQILNENLILDGTHVYTISAGETTSISVTGKRSIISTLTANDFQVTADFAELSITNAVPIKVEMTGDKMRYASQISISVRDTSMMINLEEMMSRQIPVELEYRGVLPDDVVIDEANISPKKVVISAPQSLAEAARAAVVTAESAFIDSDMTMTLEPVIRSEEGSVIRQEGAVSLDETQISVEFKVSDKKDVPIVVNVSGSAADGYVFDGVELSQDTITVKGAAEDIRKLSRIVVPADVIQLNGAEEDFEVELDVTPYLPENIVVYGESPALTVQVRISPEESQKEGEE